MKVVAFVPVKMNSRRTPGKNIRQFGDGKSLVTFFLERLLLVKEYDDIYIYCSDDKIKDFIPHGIRFLKRPSFLDADEATPQDIIREFMKSVDSDIYSICHCTSPFVSVDHLRECVVSVREADYDSSFTAEPVQKLMWTDNCQPLNFDPSNIPRTQDLPLFYNEVSASYVFDRSVFEKFNRRIGVNPHITKVTGIECIDIDYPDDFLIANAVYMNIRTLEGND